MPPSKDFAIVLPPIFKVIHGPPSSGGAWSGPPALTAGGQDGNTTWTVDGFFLAMRTLVLKVYRPEQLIPAGYGVQAR